MQVDLYVVSRTPKLGEQMEELSLRPIYLAANNQPSSFFSSLLFRNKVEPNLSKSTFRILNQSSLAGIPEESLILAEADALLLPNGKVQRAKRDCVLVVVVESSQMRSEFVSKYGWREDDVVVAEETTQEEFLSALVMKQAVRDLRA
ncbi:hypothetical protein BASA81_003604 [Batrachochytrium salamandrivorans]|nr:hypothetical protein BASA81_003604 [Batrachochytrium salamandrivorans]